jgi:hypothetical protein
MVPPAEFTKIAATHTVSCDVAVKIAAKLNTKKLIFT